MTAVYITINRQRTLPNINEEKSVHGQINQIIHGVILDIAITYCWHNRIASSSTA